MVFSWAIPPKNPPMNPNYQYILDKAQDTGGRFLDFGCGAGDLVVAGRKAGLSFYGAEVFYKGGDTSKEVEKKGLLGNAIREIKDGIIPFMDDYFDLVSTNQVVEHVENIEEVLIEIRRVLKPGGISVHFFPSKGIFREGHCGIPLLHWFPKNTRGIRFLYAYLFRSLGLGFFKDERSKKQWVNDFLDWLDHFTWYRTRKDLRSVFEKYLSFELVEDDYLRFRVGKPGRTCKGKLLDILPVPMWVKVRLMRQSSGMVVLARKGDPQ